MPDNYDRRLKSRKNWEFEYMGQVPDKEKIPKEGDKFYILTEEEDLGEELTVDSVGYNIDMGKFTEENKLPQTLYGVVPYEDDSRTYEIYWNVSRNCWTALKVNMTDKWPDG